MMADLSMRDLWVRVAETVSHLDFAVQSCSRSNGYLRPLPRRWLRDEYRYRHVLLVAEVCMIVEDV
jgi:hypothetical protein